VWESYQNDEAYDCDAVGTNHEWSASAVFVCEDGTGDGADEGEKVDRNRE
jgi:hypothetical protein